MGTSRVGCISTAGGFSPSAMRMARPMKSTPVLSGISWVQIGVGRDTSAIAFDWRKFVKQAPALFKGRTAYISDMGRTNRILAGPFESQKAASTFLAAAKKADFGSAFIWTSPAGQVVDPISAK